MCGIFGIHLKKLEKLNLNLSKDIEILSLLSKKRGQDTFGLLISSINEEKIEVGIRILANNIKKLTA